MQALLLAVAPHAARGGEVQQGQAPARLQHAAERGHLAAAVADELGIGREQRLDLREVSPLHGLRKALQQRGMGLGRRRKARTAGLYMAAGAVHELAAGGLAAAQGLGHLGIVGIEDLAQQEGRTFVGGELLQHEHQGRGHVVGTLQQVFGRGGGLLGPGLDQGLGQPEALVVLALGAQAAQPVYGQARGHGDQPGLGLLYAGALGAMPAQPGFLDQVFGIGALAQHAVGQAEQARAVALEQRQGIVRGGGGLHAIKTRERGVL